MTAAGDIPPQHDPLTAAACELKARHHVSRRPPRRLDVLDALAAIPAWTERARIASSTAEPATTKAAEWILDNYLSVDRAVRQVREDLPTSFYRRLPRLDSPEADEDGLPRTFCLAHALLSATHLQPSLPAAVQFIDAYQGDAPLSIGELWALPTMLRMACLEILVAATDQIFPSLDAPFTVSRWVSQFESLEPTERVARALGSLVTIDAIPWKDFFDRTSRVEAILKQDPHATYARMDFDTRDRYRKAVEDLADGARRAEWDVATTVLEQARAGCDSEDQDRDRRAHVGYWLIGAGRAQLEVELDYRVPAGLATRRWVLEHPGACYATALTGTTAAITALPAAYLWTLHASVVSLVTGALLALLPATIVSVSLVHWLVMQLVPPRVLPKLDLADGLPDDCRTAVVIPVIVGGPAEVPGLLERLEMHWLTNADPNARFALLSDLTDAPSERVEGDAAVEAALVDGIRELNRRYRRGSGDGAFHLLHRTRRYNACQNCWMCWERKRGKLEQFNRFLLGEADDFPLKEGATDALRGTRYVVTVDADTMLPRGAMHRLVGTLAHPLNHAEFDPVSGRVRAGYTVLQPRVEITPQSSPVSWFARLYAGDTSIDIYSRAVSDVYQDLFGSAVYVGKGVYEVGPFQHCLEGRVPDNALLSHDLFEGAHGRAALVSDIALYDSFPASYVEFSKRWHRWVRGDWQLAPWLFPKVRSQSGERIDNGIAVLDRWKMLDNLRRSVLPLSLVMFLLGGWFLLPGSPVVWTLLAVAAPGTYLLTDFITALNAPFNAVRAALRGSASRLGHWALSIVFLAADAWISVDAIVRTLARLHSRRRLLEWTSAAHTAASYAHSSHRAAAWRMAWPGSALAAATAVSLAVLVPHALAAAAPLLVVWLASPGIAAWVSRPATRIGEALDERDRMFLRRIARQTWLYFETFVGPEDNWLPPDNVQEDPYRKIGHRTSPTNIGMMFASSLTAWDLGYLGGTALALRIRSALDAIDRLERYRGQVLNWYDTRTLAPLEPRYVSTVDNGNLAVCLVVLKEGCREIADAAPLREQRWDGLLDTLAPLTDALRAHPADIWQRLSEPFEQLVARIERARDAPGDWHAALMEITDHTWPELEGAIAHAITAPDGPPTPLLRDVHVWLERVTHHLGRMRWNFDTLQPWCALAQTAPPSLEAWAERIVQELSPSTPIPALIERCTAMLEPLEERIAREPDPAAKQWLVDLAAALERGSHELGALRQHLLDNAVRAEAQAFAMNFELLYDADARLFRIGYNVSNDRIDPHFYDLLATEARLASYFAIAKRDVPTEHWFYLRRPTTRADGELSLLSWNGSMFEYLMPALFLRSASDKLLGESERAAVSIQRRYADGLGLPWGISESAFAARDAEHHYQYRAFGVPGLGLRRGLARDVVIAPYASALALAVAPRAAVRNLERLAELGAEGLYGFVEALDFTPERVAAGRSFTTIQAYMAHHQGMLLTAVGNVLTNDALVRRFAADMRIRSASLLLQERIPWELPPVAISEEPTEPPTQRRAAAPVPISWIPHGGPVVPNMHLLGNGRLASWVAENGGGGLWWYRQQLTRWTADTSTEPYGLWIYLHDRDSNDTWSVGREPTGVASSDARVVFHSHAAEFHRRDHRIALAMEVGVAPGDDLEIRRLRIVNESDRTRRLSITSYGEVVLGAPLEDERHPAFSKLFVGSEYLPGLNALLFTRRPRGSSDQPPVLLHRLVVDDPQAANVDYETDRAAFLGRGGGIHLPDGLGKLSRTTGWTLDPIMSLQFSIELAPQQHQEIAFVTFAAGSRESVLELAERYATLASLDWALNDAGREAARDVERVGLPAARLPQLQMLASLLLMPCAALSATATQISANRLGQPALWALGISGDLPILLLHTRAAGAAELEFLIRGHQLWRRQGLQVDLVILRGGVSGYEEPVRERVLALMHEAGAGDSLGRRGGIHLVFDDLINAEQRRMLECLAAVILDADSGLDAQLNRVFQPRSMPPPFRVAEAVYDHVTTPIERPSELAFDNGFGGFTADGSEYVMYLEVGHHTPAPWCNVIANESFGCLTTETGGGFTWAVNSGENRLTPWSNDPVIDLPAEALYLRDEETAQVWTSTPAPMGNGMPCQIRHGAGYTTWTTRSHGLEQEMTVFVAVDDPVKVVRLKLTDLTGHARRITATYYLEWLLGSLRSLAHRHVVCEYEPRGGALLARNPWNPEFAERVAFLASTHPAHSVTTDRTDFLGAEGSLAHPAGLYQWDLGGYVGASSDPCAAFQVHVDLTPAQSVEVAFVLGQGRDRTESLALIERWSDAGEIGPAFDAVRSLWQERLGAVQVETPDRAFDLMINQWLIYQTMASRVLARAGFYQASGGIGFRDQLQDMLALLHVEPDRVREHILHCAAHQFEEGDVMHWWHPPSGRGVRTRCSDDLLWLPYVTSCYVAATGDHGILDEGVPFLRAAVLAPEEEDRYALFESSHERRPLFEHCIRALDHAAPRGPHRLPLIGTGDWNDGMNRLGQRGRGESIWLAWFSIATLEGFAPLARSYGRAELADAYAQRIDDLRDAVEQIGWDGEWYLRALDDDGRPVGSARSDECRIDSLAQSWAVLSATVPTDHARTALDSAVRELVRDDERVALLLWPPFHDTPRDIGYIKAYPPGIRENGGQYTHAAAWLGHAFAKLGDGAGAWRIFDLLNPIHHGSDHDKAMRYRAEPYVLAGDVGSVAPHIGRAGWSWYTGAAGWTWRLGVEAILGLERRDGGITLDPCLPPLWGRARIRVRGPAGQLSIEIEDPEHVGSGVVATSLDGQPLRSAICPLPTDGTDHVVKVVLGRAHSQASTGA